MRKWWHAIGSDRRFTPRWWQRRAYAAGLRDALRIMEAEVNKVWHENPPVKDMRPVIGRAVGDRALNFEKGDFNDH